MPRWPNLVRLLVLLILMVPRALPAQSNGSGGEVLRLRPGDALRLEVRDEPGFASDYFIDADGRVLLPIVGLLEVAGLPFNEVQRAVVAAYARELANAETRIRLQPVLRIIVLGEVFRPGHISVDPTMTLLDVIASAGGPTASADRDAITLLRGGRPIIETTMDGLLLERVAILSGDQIVVGRRSWVRENVPLLVGAGASIVATLITALLLR